MASPILTRAARMEAFAAWKASDCGRSQLDEWCEEHAQRYEVEPKKLHAWIIDETANELSRAKLESATDAQKMARLVGATLQAALKVDVEALSAVKVKILVDRNGKEKGRVETPDYEARHNASKEIKKVLGAYAAEKLEVLAGPLDEFAALTDEQLKREIAKYRKGAGVETPEGIDGAEGGEGLPVLSNERDANKGRAGRTKSIQALSIESAVLSTDSRRAQ